MLRGYHSLTSGMLTQSRVLNTISNNMGNASTPGFKKDKVSSTTFKEQMLYRIPNTRNATPVEIGASSQIRYVDNVATNFAQGMFEETGRPCDFALANDGFFNIQTQEGVVYTRNGSFTLDDEGYLSIPSMGRVIGNNGPILLNTDKFQCDPRGNIYVDGTMVDKIAVTTFTDNNLLAKINEGAFTNPDPANVNANGQQPDIMWQTLERSNVSAMEEMVDMMESQKALQSSSQMLKMYDQLLSKMVTEIGRI